MPFDDVCQIPSSDARAPRLGAGVFFTFEEVARVGRAPGALRCPCVYILENLKKNWDLENSPNDLAEILHAASYNNCKN